MATSAPTARTVRLAGTEYPLVLPTWRDPRLHLAAVIVSLQVLGQAVLHFEVSIAQILVSILTCAVLEVAITLRARRILLWPASALLTGNGVAFILRVPGTAAGDWWSLRGAWLFALCAAVSIGTKYVLREGDRPLFNPSNIGLVLVFLAFGTRVVNPQDLWWGNLSPGLALTWAVILVGGFTLARRLHLVGIVAPFWLAFAAMVGLLAASGHCITARWHVGPVCGTSFATTLALSPEVFVFMFFMITDPRTSPAGRVARVAYGGLVGVAAGLLVAPGRTEFWTKVGLLGGLVVVCALRPLLEWVLPTAGTDEDRLWRWFARPRLLRRLAVATAASLVLLIAAGLPARHPAAVAAPVAAVGVTRPAVTLAPGDLPPVSVDPTVRSIQVAATPALATQLATDLVVDLVIEDDAFRDHDVALVATAATGRELGTVQHQVGAGGRAPAHRFSALVVVPVKDPLRPQDPARLGIRVPGGRTYALTLVGDHYLIALEVTP